MSFPAILVLLVAVTGVIWLLDKLFFAGKRAVAGRGEPVVVEYARAFFPIILIVLVIRSFVVEPFRIPSGSMLPTLHIGDFILVNKFSYGVRLPVVHTKILASGTPERGDVVVFRYPNNPRVDYIKRLIGMPGDTIAYDNKTITVNGKAVTMTAVERDGSLAGQVPESIQQFSEDLEGVVHPIFHNNERYGMTGEFIVPEGEYFMMGDNRDHSNDSRFWGTVPEANLVGKAFFVWMSWDAYNKRVALSRLGTSIL